LKYRSRSGIYTSSRRRYRLEPTDFEIHIERGLDRKEVGRQVWMQSAEHLIFKLHFYGRLMVRFEKGRVDSRLFES
jgi:hypothetical protein